MKTEHPITPPPELVQQWLGNYFGCIVSGELSPSETFLATQAALWGADQELEACREWLKEQRWEALAIHLRAARRPKPPSLKEQALQALANADGADHPVVVTVLTADEHALIRKALEQLDD